MLDYKTYSEMLKIQTDMCFPFEYNFYDKLGISSAKVILELGCGNAYFLNKLRYYFSSPEYFGYDNSRELIDIALADDINDGMTLKLGSVDDIREKADFLVLRLIMHQVSDRHKFLTQAMKSLKPNGTVIIVDSLDEKFQLFPQLPNFMARLRGLRKTLSPDLATRRVKEPILHEMQQLGYFVLEHEHYFVPSLLCSYKDRYRDYMIATNNMLGYSEVEVAEIGCWHANPSSYAQIGLFMYAFKKLIDSKEVN